MTKIQGSHYFEKALHDKLRNYCNCNGFRKSKNDVIVTAVEGFLLNDVDVEDMTTKEVKAKWNEVNTRIQQLRELEAKLFVRLEDD